MLAYLDWLLHLSVSPSKQTELVEHAGQQWGRLISLMQAGTSGRETLVDCEMEPSTDSRFSDPAWQQWPFNLMAQQFLMLQHCWQSATTGVRGVDPHHEDVVAFCARQWLDMLAPSNFLATNPELLTVTTQECGLNLVRGAQNFLDDLQREVTHEKAQVDDAFKVGKGVAITPGKVVFRNQLIELIQYAPTTQKVYPEPVLIVPSWIMKYYVLDLSPHNSLVRYLVAQGHTVFMVSWKNPHAEDRDLGMNDYLQQGVLKALEVVNEIIPETKINAVGYCLGGTLLLIAAAWLARQKSRANNTLPLGSITLLAAQADFEESGELSLFTDSSQIAWLEDIMWDQGYLDGDQIGGTFALLRSRDLIWSRMVHDYLRGTRQPLIDLMAWNEDATRLPYRMHSEYLRHLYHNNELAHGRYQVDDKPVALSDSHTPMFVVATVKDHVSPWRSVYKIHLLSNAEITFVLSSGGHNAGIVSEPDHPGRTYQMTTRKPRDQYVDPQTWLQATPTHQGSWWPAWQQWLSQHSTAMVSPPAIGNARRGHVALTDAPGTFVMGD